MARLVILGLGQEFLGRADRSGMVRSGVEMFAISLDRPPSDRGFAVFKVPLDKQKLFPRLASAYDVSYVEEDSQYGPRQVMSDAVYLGAWSVESGVELVGSRSS